MYAPRAARTVVSRPAGAWSWIGVKESAEYGPWTNPAKAKPIREPRCVPTFITGTGKRGRVVRPDWRASTANVAAFKPMMQAGTPPPPAGPREQGPRWFRSTDWC